MSSYNIPLVAVDLRRAETIHQLCDTFTYLEKMTDDVFTRIEKRISDNLNRLATLNNRVSVAQAKIDRVKGSNKATKVFASCKFPSVESPNSDDNVFKALFNQDEKSAAMKEARRHHYNVQEKFATMDEKLLKDKSVLYKARTPVHPVKNLNEQGEGLGRLPKSIESVSSLLLFNTSQNPYKTYVMLDPLGMVQRKVRATFDDDSDGLADAPHTIAQREELQRTTGENYFYSPHLGQVPEIEVPDFLPDLLGVADDLAYSAEFGRSIAPSVPGSNLPDLPAIVSDEPNLPQPYIEIARGAKTAPVGEAIVSSSTIPLPPPPPPPPPPPSALPPPPPPPPLSSPNSSLPVVEPPSGAATAKPQNIPAEVSDNSRSSLMDEIRKAGGFGKVKLKEAKGAGGGSRKKKRDDVAMETTASGAGSGGGDLMSDLANKLRLRRKGISGTNRGGLSDSGGGTSAGGVDAGGVMSRISTLIPPPPSNPSGQSSASRHTDEGDEDGWQ